jgi:hypothetical protein
LARATSAAAQRTTAAPWRLRAAPPPLPATITLPDGTTATAFTQADDWFAVVTDDDRILIFDRDTGALVQTVAITRP